MRLFKVQKTALSAAACDIYLPFRLPRCLSASIAAHLRMPLRCNTPGFVPLWVVHLATPTSAWLCVCVASCSSRFSNPGDPKGFGDRHMMSRAFAHPCRPCGVRISGDCGGPPWQRDAKEEQHRAWLCRLVQGQAKAASLLAAKLSLCASQQPYDVSDCLPPNHPIKNHHPQGPAWLRHKAQPSPRVPGCGPAPGIASP